MGWTRLTSVDDAGRMRDGLPEYDGLTVFEANAPIIELLEARGALMGAVGDLSLLSALLALP